MKRTFSVVSALVALVVLAGCKEKDDTPPEVAAASPTTSTTPEATTTTPADETPVSAADETSSVPQPEIPPLPEGVTFDIPRVFQKLAPYVAQGLRSAFFGASSTYVVDGPMLTANCPAQTDTMPSYESGESWVLLCDMRTGFAAVAKLNSDGTVVPDSVSYVNLRSVALNRDRDGDVYSYDVFHGAGTLLTPKEAGGFDNYSRLAYWKLDEFTTNFLGKSLQEFMAS